MCLLRPVHRWSCAECRFELLWKCLQGRRFPRNARLGSTSVFAAMVLGGSWVVLISKVTILITLIRGLYNPTYNYP